MEYRNMICATQIREDGKIVIDFSSDKGKFGTNELLASWALTPERLYQILDERQDIQDDEI